MYILFATMSVIFGYLSIKIKLSFIYLSLSLFYFILEENIIFQLIGKFCLSKQYFFSTSLFILNFNVSNCICLSNDNVNDCTRINNSIFFKFLNVCFVIKILYQIAQFKPGLSNQCLKVVGSYKNFIFNCTSFN